MKKRKILPKLLKFHNIIGLFVCLVLIHLSVTGIALNHTDKLNLNQTKISWDWLLNTYGISVPETKIAFSVEDNFFHLTNSQIFMNTQSIMRSEDMFVGVIELDSQFIISTTDSMILINKSGDFIRKIKLPEISVPKINKIGSYSNGIIVEINEIKFISDKNLENWEPKNNSDADKWSTEISVPLENWVPKNNYDTVKWSTEISLSGEMNNQIKKYYVGEGITIEQIILDLHSGVIFKSAGKFFMDMIALLLIFMSISGVWIWFVKKTKKKLSR